MKKIYVNVNVRLIINANDDVDVTDVLDNMDYDFSSETDGAEIVDTEIIDYDIQDSK